MTCVETGEPFRAIVMYNLDPEAYYVIDTGCPRRAADILHLHFKTASVLSFWLVLEGLTPADRHPQNMQAVYDQHSGSIEFAMEHWRKGHNGLGKAVLPATVARAHACGANPDRLIEFFKYMYSSIGMKPGDNGADEARKYIVLQRNAGVGYYAQQYAHVSYCLACFLNNTKVNRLTPSKVDPFPVTLNVTTTKP
jgi:hypothetical protein